RYDLAEQLYRQSLEQNPRGVRALNNLAWLRVLRGEHGAEPLALIDRAIALAGRLPALLDTRAAILQAQGPLPDALRDLEQALELKPSATYSFHLARAQLQARNKAGAVASFRKAKAEGLNATMLHPLDRAHLAQLERELQ